MSVLLVIAMSCMRFVSEEGTLELTSTTSKGQPIAPPASVIGLDQIMNTPDAGASILMQSPDMGYRKFYKLSDPATPSDATRAHIEAAAKVVLTTGCGTQIPYAVLRPGTYVLDKERLVIDDTRSTATLSYFVRKAPYVSTFKIKDLTFSVPLSSGIPASSGAVDVKTVIRSNLNQIRRCYEHELQRSPNASGRIQAVFTITKDGKVASYRAGEDTTVRSQPFLDCVAGKVKAWRFSPPADGKETHVDYPFVFSPI